MSSVKNWYSSSHTDLAYSRSAPTSSCKKHMRISRGKNIVATVFAEHLLKICLENWAKPTIAFGYFEMLSSALFTCGSITLLIYSSVK